MRLRTITARLRSDAGFGLVEMVIALTLLSVGMFALIATYSSGSTALLRASRIGSAGVVADTQMERYRALRYDEIGLDVSSIPTSGDYVAAGTPYSSVLSPVALSPCTTAEICSASRSVTGPDGRSYQVDVYMYWVTPTGGRATKRVAVVVRDDVDGDRILARQVSTFDLYAGCFGSACAA